MGPREVSCNGDRQHCGDVAVTGDRLPFARVMHGEAYVRPGEVVRRHTKGGNDAKVATARNTSDAARAARRSRRRARDVQGRMTDEAGVSGDTPASSSEGGAS